MKFCTNCGHQNIADGEFCSNCGQPFSPEEEHAVSSETSRKTEPATPPGTHRAPMAAAAPPPPTRSAPPPVKKPMKKSTKILTVLAGILAVALIATHLTLQSIYDPMKKIDAMNSAYNNQDKEGFFNQFTFKKGTIADPNRFYTLINQYGWTDLRGQLTDQAERIQNKEPADIIYHSGEFISTTKKPVLLGLYQDVDFTVIPTNVTVQLPLAGMTFTFEGQEVTSTSEDEIVQVGKFLPGEYTWAYKTDGGMMPLHGNGDYILSASDTNEHAMGMDWGFTTLYLESDLEDAIVFINGKSTGKKVEELAELYPAQLDKSVTIQAVGKSSDGKEVKSTAVPADTQDIYLPFEHVQQEQQLSIQIEEVEQFYQDFRSDFADAIYYANFSYIEDYFKAGSEIRKDYAKFVTDHSTIPGYNYEFLLNDITTVKPVSDSSFELYSFEKFNFSSYEDSPLRYDRKKKYVISYGNDRYYFDAITDLETKKTKF